MFKELCVVKYDVLICDFVVKYANEANDEQCGCKEICIVKYDMSISNIRDRYKHTFLQIMSKLRPKN